MAPRLTPAELDYIFELDRAGRRPIEIHAALTRKRTRHGIATPTLARLCAALRGATHRRPRKETRGHKRHAARQMGEKRKQLIKPAGVDGQPVTCQRLSGVREGRTALEE